jgi:hypothetical protein
MPEPDKYSFLRQEAKAPYRPLRRFFYLACGFSGFLGGLIALLRLLAGRGALPDNLQNLALQVAVTAVVLWLWCRDR